MDKLNELEILAKAVVKNVQCRSYPIEQFLDAATPESILAIAKAFRELEHDLRDANVCVEAAKQEIAELEQRAEVAESSLGEEKSVNSKLREDRAGLARECNAFEAQLAELAKREPECVVTTSFPGIKEDYTISKILSVGTELFTRPVAAAVLVDGSKLGEWLSNEFGIHPQQYAAYISSFYQEVMQTHEVPAGMLRRIEDLK